MSTSAPTKTPTDVSSLSEIFAQKVVPGSSRYWATHFSAANARTHIQAIFCFAHLMDELAVVSTDVIRDKSVWWHEELQRFAQAEPRHPVLKALLTFRHETAAECLHTHLHGALMTQQQIPLSDYTQWAEYAQLRIGSLHELLGLANNFSVATSRLYGQWAAELALLATARTPQYFNDGRWSQSCPSELTDLDEVSLTERMMAHQSKKPSTGTIASEVLVHHDCKWWSKPASGASPLYSNIPVGLRGMLNSWHVARSVARLHRKAGAQASNSTLQSDHP